MDKAAHIATATSYAASGGAVVIGGLSVNEIGVVGGLLLAFATFVVNWVYQHRRYQLDKVRVRGGGGSDSDGSSQEG